MKVTVLYFAVFRERLRKDTEIVELADGVGLDALVAALEDRYPEVRALRGKYRIAVNQEMVAESPPLHDGDEIALIPPVAGGSEPRRHAVVLDTPLSLDRVVEAVRSPGAGGVVTFTGMVRLMSHGARIERLEYEAYREMAEKVMRALCDEIEAEIPGARLAVEHRVGVLAVGEIAVVIAAAAAHRAEAFTACRAMIDRLKDRVPIWKKEIGENGETWVGLGP
jgi:molybdopterin synthase catalytic subunit